jgi:hypothetical protein
MRADDIFVEEAQQDPAKFAVEVFLEICYQKARQDPRTFSEPALAGQGYAFIFGLRF